MPVKISSIILNWNRLPLLKRTIESYLSTTPERHELFIVDNGSSDGSREYLENLHRDKGGFELIVLKKNIGGKAVNAILPRCQGDLIQFIENDQEFIPGWYDYVEKSFANFAELGQLSLFAPVPTDDEAWEAKPCHLVFAGDDFLYQAHANCGFSSVLRASMVREHGITVSNVSDETEYLFPDDGKLSKDVKDAGYFCAHSKNYFVRNLGHFVEEFERDEDYYRKNYQSKPWLGEEGWLDRIASKKSSCKPVRTSHIFPLEPILPEKTSVRVGSKSPTLWSMLDGYTAEIEVLEFLYSFVRLIKPTYIVETGTWRGYSACAMGLALAQNGFGNLTSVESNKNIALVAEENVRKHSLEKIVAIVNILSMDFLPSQPVEFALLDSDIGIRHLEFLNIKKHFSPDAFVMFHDVAPHHGALNDNVRNLVAEELISGLELPTPRGLFLGKVTSTQ